MATYEGRKYKMLEIRHITQIVTCFRVSMLQQQNFIERLSCTQVSFPFIQRKFITDHLRA